MPKYRNDDKGDEGDDGKYYRPDGRPIAKDKPRSLFAHGKPIYKRSNSLFGHQKRTTQLPINSDYRTVRDVVPKKTENEHIHDPLEETDSLIVHWYVHHGYNPREIYKPEEAEYQRAIKVLNEIDYNLGRLQRPHVEPKLVKSTPLPLPNSKQEHMPNPVKLLPPLLSNRWLQRPHVEPKPVKLTPPPLPNSKQEHMPKPVKSLPPLLPKPAQMPKLPPLLTNTEQIKQRPSLGDINNKCVKFDDGCKD